MSKPKKIAVLGSTGSIGTRCLDLVRRLPERFRVRSLAAGTNIEALAEQVREFRPDLIVVGDPEASERFLERHSEWRDRHAGCGSEALDRLAEDPGADVVLNALVGSVGLVPTLRALERGKDVALANKEALVVGGPLLLAAAARSGARILPVDSEHSGVFQVLDGRDPGDVTKVILTASGGPFRRWSRDRLTRVSPAQVTDHPTWDMGPKISVDSATLMNKGLEVIEAHHLFSVGLDRIEVLIHPQSVVHALVEYRDGSVIAQLSDTDMRIPLLHALGYPARLDAGLRRLDLVKLGKLEFEPVDGGRFPCLELAYRAARSGGTAPAVLNGANETAVEALLAGELPFLKVAAVIRSVLEEHRAGSEPSLSDLVGADRWARRRAREAIASIPSRA